MNVGVCVCRWQAHIWICSWEDLEPHGGQVYLGGYACEHHAAAAYDVVALKLKGHSAETNFDIQRSA